MTRRSGAMRLTHDRDAKSALSFCIAQKYTHPNTADVDGLKTLHRFMEQERLTEMSIKQITDWFEGWKRYRAAVRELSLLTDRELTDLGIQRSEIDLVARQSLSI